MDVLLLELLTLTANGFICLSLVPFPCVLGWCSSQWSVQSVPALSLSNYCLPASLNRPIVRLSTASFFSSFRRCWWQFRRLCWQFSWCSFGRPLEHFCKHQVGIQSFFPLSSSKSLLCRQACERAQWSTAVGKERKSEFSWCTTLVHCRDCLHCGGAWVVVTSAGNWIAKLHPFICRHWEVSALRKGVPSLSYFPCKRLHSLLMVMHGYSGEWSNAPSDICLASIEPAISSNQIGVRFIDPLMMQ